MLRCKFDAVTGNSGVIITCSFCAKSARGSNIQEQILLCLIALLSSAHLLCDWQLCHSAVPNSLISIYADEAVYI